MKYHAVFDIELCKMNSVYVLEYLLLAVTVSYGSNDVYYVIPTTGNQTCPTGQVCYDISYYTKFNFSTTDNITLIFLEGQHILNDTLEIYGPDNVTLIGQGYDHWSTVISCCYNCTGIQIYTPDVICLEGLTYINGSLDLNNEFIYYEIPTKYLYMHSMSLQNASVTVSANYVTITDSILDNTNCIEKWCRGLLYLSMYESSNIHVHNITIQGVTRHNEYSDVLYFGQGYGPSEKVNTADGALNLVCNGQQISVFKLTDVTITNNDATGIYIYNCAVEFGNVTIFNNHSPFNGGGMRISTQNYITSLPNTTVSFINNRAKGVGGAIYIDSALDTNGNSFLHFH